jgi:transcriptional regulator with XRE-family HTH domain
MPFVSTLAQRRALGDFLRAHRARMQPSAFGLEAGRRRTPGLRREELAQLCGVSVTWYTWIEQGRDISVSPAALARLAMTLRLTAAERAYLFDLAGKHDPVAPAHATDAALPATLGTAIEAFALPAYVLDRRWDALCANGPARDLFCGWLRLSGESNLLRYIFLDPSARHFICDWEDRARRVLAEFRVDYSRHLEASDMRGLVDDLTHQSPFFARIWAEQTVLPRAGGERRFNHPTLGLVLYEQLSFSLAHQPELKLVLLVKANGR